MTDPQIFAWILISVSDHGGTLQDLIAQADAIMHCFPTPQELQKSLGWLIHRGLGARPKIDFLKTDPSREAPI